MEAFKYIFRINIIAILCIYFCSFLIHAQTFDTNVPEGFSVVSASNLQSTTGGGNGNIVTAKTYSELTTHCANSAALIILVEGTINGTNPINVKSNKTILGKGANAKLNGCGLNMNGVSNIIIRNLTITGSADGVAARETHHLWVDHCDIYDNGDGLLDITLKSSYVTVSWCKFYYINQTEHRLACLIGSGGGDHPEDWGHLKVTYHHNWYDKKVDQRMPRIMYGQGHVFNDYYTCSGNSYCINVGSYGAALVENNYFKGVNNPHGIMYDIYCWMTARGNVYDNTTGQKFSGKGGSRDVSVAGWSFPVAEFNTTPYLYRLDKAADVPNLVSGGSSVHAEYGSIGLTPTPGQGAMNVKTNQQLQWAKGTIGQNATSYKVYFGTSANPALAATVNTQSYNPGTLLSGTVYYWRVDMITQTGTIEGKLWHFKTDGTTPVNPPPVVSITSPANNTVLNANASITLNATASDANGTVTNVQFYNGTTLLGSDATSPYSYTWTNIPAGTHSITAVATDNGGAKTTSSIITIKVNPKPIKYIYTYDNSGNYSWTNTNSWTPKAVPTDIDTVIIRTGEVQINALTHTAPVYVETNGILRLVTANSTINKIYMQGGTLKVFTSSPELALTSDITVEKPSTIMAGSVAATVFTLNGTITGSSNLTKTSVGILRINSTATGFKGNWIINEGKIQLRSATGLGVCGVQVKTGARLDIEAAGASIYSLVVDSGGGIDLDQNLNTNVAVFGTENILTGAYKNTNYPTYIGSTAALNVSNSLVVLNGPAALCTGNSLTATASSGASYIWKNNTTQVGTAAAYTTSAAGSYTVDATNAAGCKVTSAPIITTVVALPSATISSPATSFCAGGSVILFANTGTGLTYQWSNAAGTISGATAATYTAAAAGAYSVKVTNTSGCKATSAVTQITVNTLPTATITAPLTSFCTGGSVLLTASAGSSYKWFNGTTQVGTAANYTTTAVGSYTVEITNASGCKAISAVTQITLSNGTAWYADTDGDGKGDPTVSQTACTQPAGYVSVAGDACPLDANKTTAGSCGCGKLETDTDGDGTADCIDNDDDNDGATDANDCQPLNAVVTVATKWYQDTDGDGKGDPAVSQTACTQPAGYVSVAGDTCPLDANKTTPGDCGCGKVETDTDRDGSADCIDNDDDNDGVADTNDCQPLNAAVTTTANWYQDADGDGKGDPSSSLFACAQPAGYVSTAGDTCPSDPNKTTPGDCGCGQVETDTDGDGSADCIENDDDNDGVIDANDCQPLNAAITAAVNWYQDTDGDGKGDPSSSLFACTQPAGYVSTAGDTCPSDPNKTTPGDCGCDNKESSCLDCAGTPNGTAVFDNCNVCTGGTTGKAACITTATVNGTTANITVSPQPFDNTTTIKLENNGNIQSITIISAAGALVDYKSGINNTEITIGDSLAAGLYSVIIQTDKGILTSKIVKK